MRKQVKTNNREMKVYLGFLTAVSALTLSLVMKNPLLGELLTALSLLIGVIVYHQLTNSKS